jgi:hypothetical protein
MKTLIDLVEENVTVWSSAPMSGSGEMLMSVSSIEPWPSILDRHPDSEEEVKMSAIQNATDLRIVVQ